MTFTVIDWIFGIVILTFAIVGLIKGFVENVFGKLSWILGIILACIFYDDAGNLVLSSINNTILRNILSFLIVFIVVFLIVKLAQVIVAKIFEGKILKSLDRTLGFFFGAAEGLAITGLSIFLLSVQPFFSVENLFDGSFFYSIFGVILEKGQEGLSNV